MMFYLGKSFRSCTLRNNCLNVRKFLSTAEVRRRSRISLAAAGTLQEFDHLTGKKSQVDPFWIEQLSRIEKPVARSLIPLLIDENALGFESQATGVARKGTLLEFAINQKILHREKVILIRSGEFYETYGVDAVLLVAFCGLNPMGGKCKAGCPVKNIQAVLDGLTSQGLSVCVFEEINEADTAKLRGSMKLDSSKSKIKRRYLAQVVSPASPTYFASDLCLRADDIEYRETRPAVGILGTQHGYTLCEVYFDERMMLISDRLSVEAVRSTLEARGYVEPLYLQDIPQSPFLHLPARIHKLSGFNELSFPTMILKSVSKSLEMEIDDEFCIRRHEYLDRPRPLYTSTALQIGLLPNDNVPRLLPSLLPLAQTSLSTSMTASSSTLASASASASTSAASFGFSSQLSTLFATNRLLSPAARFLHRWLLHPPPREQCDYMQQLCQQLATLQVALPFSVGNPLPEGKLLSLLYAQQGNVALFRDLRRQLDFVLDVITSHESNVDRDFRPLLDPLFQLVSWESGRKVVASELIEGCRSVRGMIDQIIVPESDDRSSLGPSIPTPMDLPFEDPHRHIPSEFFLRNEEEFRGHILRNATPAIEQLYQELEMAARQLCQAVHTDFFATPSVPLSNADIVFDVNNNAIMFKSKPSGSSSSETGSSSTSTTATEHPNVTSEIEYFTPRDRRGVLIPKRYTSLAVESALSNYQKVVQSASRQIAQVLQDLSGQCLLHVISIAQATHFSIILHTMQAHVSRALQQGWVLPTLEDFSSSPTSSQQPRFELRGLIPYWMSRASAQANDYSSHGITFLTAPNMSGKSTFMRAVLVIALLANCGLFVPCQSAIVPRFDSFFLRTASYDVPSEAKSAFALEMDDVRVMLRDCSSKSIVMIDELGKGTSSKDGSALSGALLEYLSQQKLHGIFATHLHEILSLPLKLNDVQYKRMSVAFDDQGKLHWTYKLEDGVCLDSMAIHTAKQYQIHESILNRAEELSTNFDHLFRSNFSLSLSSSSSSPSSSSSSLSSWIMNRMDNGTSCHDMGDGNGRRSMVVDQCHYDLIDFQPLLVRWFDHYSSYFSNSIIIPGNATSPPSLEGRSCLYVLRITDSNQNQHRIDELYVGETDSISQRLKQHRLHKSNDNRMVEALVVPLPNKSLARSLETSLIQRLKKEGYFVPQSFDGYHQHFSQ